MAGESKKFVIIDGKSVFYRGYYAMPNLSTKDGTPTGGVYGFAVMALEVIKRLKPDYVCVAWDKPKTNIRGRLAIYPEYKAGRKPPPPDFYTQIPVLHELLEAFGWPLYELDDYEADDIMGALAKQASEVDIDTKLVTSDLDLLQVVGPKTHVYALKTGLSNIELYHQERFEEKYQIKLEQFLDYKALIGDSSDNIPGVPGVGPVAARKLLAEHETLDGIYENIELISGGTKQKLIDGKDSAYMSKKLARIWTDAPIKLNLSEVDGSKCDPNAVMDVLKKFEFRSLVRQLPEVMKVDEADGYERADIKLSKIEIIKAWLTFDDIKFKPDEPIIIHSYLFGTHGRKPKYVVLSQKPTISYVIDCVAIDQEDLRRIFEKIKSIPIVGYDIKSSIKVAYEAGADTGPVAHDVLVGSFLVNSTRREQTLYDIARQDLDYEGGELENLHPDEFLERVPQIIGIIRSLYEKQLVEFKAIPKLTELAQKIEWPVIPVLADMEHRGILLDSEYLKKFAVELRDTISDLEQQIYGHADEEFNIASPQQLSVILFEKLKLPTQGVKKGKTGYSTAANELDKLRAQHPIIDLISQYREVTKLMSTYVETLPEQVDDDGRLHTTYSLTVAQTGRLSSNDPNLQNIPVRTELGNHIRTAFIASPGNVFVSADYSQFELRLAAVLANDKELIDMFNRDIDVHTATAAQVYGRDPEDVTKTMRRDAKVINFGIIYGMSPHGLSAATGMTFIAAKEFIDKYFELRKPLLDYMNHLKELAHSQGYVETMFGRRRPMPDINSSNYMVRQGAERAAINMPIQGTEADLMKMAMIDAQKYLESVEGAHQLLQIHDSILVECKEHDANEIADKLKEIMENVYKLPVKLTVDTSIGKNWGEL